ncbi:MAG: ABC transporter ATP-binding protein [Pseudanabaenaceae cyanobacterium]
MTVPAIHAEGLSKTYLTGFWLNKPLVSLRNCSLTVLPGETFGLLGPNGAGKTTLLKILLGIIRPTSGAGELLGAPLGDRPTKHKIGYLPENAYYYDYLTGWELLDYMAALCGVPAELRRKRLADLIDLVGLPQAAARKKQLRQYSKGMVQRIGLAQALVNDPELIFLDEPMSGLDPVGRHQIREAILHLKEQGKTVFFNTHILADVESICDRVAILHKGDTVALGRLDELLGQGDTYQVVLGGIDGHGLAEWLTDLTGEGQHWRGTLRRSPAEFVPWLMAQGGHLISLQQTRPSLEDFFIAAIRRAEAKDGA